MASNELIDVEEVVSQWVSKVRAITDSGGQGVRPNYTIDWSHLRTRSYPPKFNDWKTPEPKNVVLVNTSFCNSTETVQHHNFMCERETACKCHIAVDSGLVLREEIPLTFELPWSIREQSSGFKPELVITKSQGQTFEEVLKWQTNNDIKVQPYHTAEVHVQIQEHNLDCHFTLGQELRGQIHVTARHPVTDAFLGHSQGDIVEIFSNFNGNDNYQYIRSNKFGSYVRIETKGRCNFRYGAELHVHVTQEVNDPAEDDYDDNY